MNGHFFTSARLAVCVTSFGEDRTQAFSAADADNYDTDANPPPPSHSVYCSQNLNSPKWSQAHDTAHFHDLPSAVPFLMDYTVL